MKKKYHVLVAYKDTKSESFWCGKKLKWNPDLEKAKKFRGKEPSVSQMAEYDYVLKTFPWANPIFMAVETK